MDDIIADHLVLQRMEIWLFGIFASLAVLLPVVGLYGLISHEVEMGTREIGSRMALGATRNRVFTLILPGVGDSARRWHRGRTRRGFRRKAADRLGCGDPIRPPGRIAGSADPGSGRRGTCCRDSADAPRSLG
jgi:hypothetical protein